MFRSDVLLINTAGHHLTSDRLMGLISTGGQTEAVRPGYDAEPGLTPQSSTLQGNLLRLTA